MAAQPGGSHTTSPHYRSRAAAASIAALLAALAPGAAAIAQPGTPPNPAPPASGEPTRPPAQPAPPADAPPVDEPPLIELRPAIDALTNELLDTIEASGMAIQTMQAALIYDRRFLLQGDQHIRTGNLFFQQSAPGTDDASRPPLRRFAIAFEQLFVDNVMRRETQRIVFDGRWLVERDDTAKRFVAREVAPPGAAFDPLRLGEGPMPIPLGQRKAEILERYDARATWGGAEWIDADEAARGYRAAMDGTRQLVLTPRAAFADTDDFREIRLWYRQHDGHLVPVLSRTVARDGDVAFVRLLGFRINDATPAASQRLADALRMTPPDEPGWEIQRIEGRWDERDLNARALP